jgi:hypothetical protein
MSKIYCDGQFAAGQSQWQIISWHICVLGEGLAEEPSFFSPVFLFLQIWQTFPHKETKFVRKSLLCMPVKTSFDFSHAKNPKKVWNYCKRNQHIKTCSRDICCSTCVTGSTAPCPTAVGISSCSMVRWALQGSIRNEFWMNAWQVFATSPTPSS